MFADRIQAGHLLAQRLIDLRGSESVVLGLPRGGLPGAALVWVPETTALTPLSHETEPVSPELETEPTGF